MMKIAVRAEGSTDIGSLNNGVLIKGPMIILIEKLDCYKHLVAALGFDEGFNINDFVEWVYIHKREISASTISRKRIVLRGKKEQRDLNEDFATLRGFYENSESFSFLAKEKEADIAIFFVDTDKDWCEDRYVQVKAGLKKHDYDQTGVPMIPVKISETWLMCWLSNYENCTNHENATTDKQSQYYPKNVCEKSGYTRHEIAEKCDPNRINMRSFMRFQYDFKTAINSYMNYEVCES